MIDPLVSLAFAVQSNKGVFAVLLGSGVSRSAGIPTGWEVVLDLSRKLATMIGEDAGDDPAAWYQSKYGKEPDYSELLDALCKTGTERQQLLRSYFEPDDEERAQGLKQPTKAHRAIASLMAKGFIRVALTTNFDRLLERAIEDEGISPVVISSADAIEGAIPLAHQQCCVIKLHGDYLDTRIKNTPVEVGTYDPRVNKFLDQIFDQFGLIVCGWSGQWDVALRAAIERCPSRRFTMFWAAQREPRDESKRLIDLRAGSFIKIEDADSFFTRLNDLILGLEQSKMPHPASLDALAAITKRYLSDPKLIINLSDLVHEEIELARRRTEEIGEGILKARSRDLGVSFAEYRAAIARLQTILIHGCVFGTPQHVQLWVNVLERMSYREVRGGSNLNDGIRFYPYVVLLYSAGLAAVAGDHVGTLAAVLTRPMKKDNDGQRKAALLGAYWGELDQFCKTIPEHKQNYTPKSEHLFAVLREPLRRYLSDDDTFDRKFDEFEYLLSLVFLDLETLYSSLGMPWSPPGRFYWKARNDASMLKAAQKEFEEQQQNWGPLKVGLFGGKPERAKELQQRLSEVIGSRPFY